jgi:hypothetical protein
MSQPDWEEVGHIGDVNWAEYGGGPVYVDKTGVYPPELEYVEPPEGDFERPKARWTVYRVGLDKGVPDWGDLAAVATTTDQDPDELKAAFESDDPMERAYAYETWAGHYGWFELDSDPLTLTCAGAAEGWSSPGDQLMDDLAAEGFNPESVVVFAEFGDAVAINGEPEPEATVAGVEAKLEADGYEYLDKLGGRVPSTEGYAYADAVIDAVARRLKLPRAHVEQAAKAMDGWQEEIPGTASGATYVWAKKRGGADERRARRR